VFFSIFIIIKKKITIYSILLYNSYDIILNEKGVKMEDKKNILDTEEMILESMDSRKVRKIRKKIYRVFIVIIILIAFILFPIFFYKKELNNNLLPVSYKKGVYHIHSTFSDGTGNIEKISKAAKEKGLDFVLMTDHGRPNVKCSESTNWENGVLFIGGSEFSMNCGHLAAAGYDFKNRRNYIFPPEPQDAIDDVNKTDGITFISHPLDGKIPWTDWDIEDFTGIEILNSYSSAKKTSVLNLLIFPIQYLFDKNYALLNTVSYPTDNLKLWDDFNKKGDYYGIYALDAHSKLPITRKLVFMWPSYRAMFEIFTLYVKIDRDFDREPEISASYIVEAIKKGHFFSVIEAIASANGFQIFFETREGIKYNTGSRIDTVEGNILLELPFNFKTDIIVKRNGKIFKKIMKNFKKELRVRIEKNGTYRVEIFVSDNTFNKLPWILTNPFFIGQKTKLDKVKNNFSIKKRIEIFDKTFKIEKNPESFGSVKLELNGNEKLIRMEYDLRQKENVKDFWVALSNRKKLNFSGYSGIMFKTKSDKESRFWLELRTKGKDGELNFKHSFLSTENRKKVYISFDKFVLASNRGVKINRSSIIALFFSINNMIAYPNAKGYLEISEIALY